jgi:hypothetical protein
MWGALSDERTSLPFTIAAGPRQHSHSWVRVSRDSWPYFTVSDSRLPQPGGPGPRIYIPQEEGSPVIPPGTEFPFRPLLRLAGIRWRYSNPPPRGDFLVLPPDPRYIPSARTAHKTPPIGPLLSHDVTAAGERCLLRHRLAPGDIWVESSRVLCCLSWNKAPIWGVRPD